MCGHKGTRRPDDGSSFFHLIPSEIIPPPSTTTTTTTITSTPSQVEGRDIDIDKQACHEGTKTTIHYTHHTTAVTTTLTLPRLYTHFAFHSITTTTITPSPRSNPVVVVKQTLKRKNTAQIAQNGYYGEYRFGIQDEEFQYIWPMDGYSRDYPLCRSRHCEYLQLLASHHLLNHLPRLRTSSGLH